MSDYKMQKTKVQTALDSYKEHVHVELKYSASETTLLWIGFVAGWEAHRTTADPADLTIGGDDYLAIVERQRTEALAAIERVKALAQKWTDDFMMRDVTYDDRDDRADAKDDCAMDIRAALEATP